VNKKKLIGSYYTPKEIADFLTDYLSVKLKDSGPINILEPSAGDGIFIKSIYSNKKLSHRLKNVIAVEKEKGELAKIHNSIENESLKLHNIDFLEYQKHNRQQFSIVIGNPPYIKKTYLKETQIRICEQIHSAASLSDNKIKNVWTAFLVRSIKFLDTNGLLGFVLPSELLQVKFASELRDYLVKEFERIEIFTFNELLFSDSKGQDTLLLVGERKSKNKGVYYCNIDRISDLKKGKHELVRNVSIKQSKWTYHHLTSDEIELLEKIKKNFKNVAEYCTSKAGIVTAANEYFIVNEATVEEYSLKKFVYPIIKKGSFVNGKIVLSLKEFNQLVRDSKPSYLLNFNRNINIQNKRKVKKYLELGKQLDIHKRYKTSIRKQWYKIPNIGGPPEAFFFKRCNEYPKFIKNNAGVLVTDSAYAVSMKEGFDIESLISSFYNSLTLSFAELNGRYYGGGVLELTPNEFKGLPIPYVEIGKKGFRKFSKRFQDKNTIKEICKINDKVTLKMIDKDLNEDSLNKVFNIREKLHLRRIKSP